MGITVTGIAIVVLILVFVIWGMKSGLIRTVFGLASLFFSVIFTWILYPYVSDFLMKTSLYESLFKWFELHINNNNDFQVMLPEFLNNLSSGFKQSIENHATMELHSIIEAASHSLTIITINIISMVALFIILRFIFFLFKKFGKNINKMAVVGPVNSILGGAFGAIQGLVTVYLVVMIISYFPTSTVYNYVKNDIEVSYIAKVIYADNVKFFGIKPRYPK